MLLHSLMVDPCTQIIMAVVEYKGARHRCCVWWQHGSYYVHFGNEILYFSPAQAEVYDRFRESGKTQVEYSEATP